LEWLSFLNRYVPVGVLERVDGVSGGVGGGGGGGAADHIGLTHKAPSFCARSDLEKRLASKDCREWVRITEMFLGNVPDGFFFTEKHKSNAYAADAAPSGSATVVAAPSSDQWG
jgi:tRNA-dihydrouridine synthase 3